MNFRSYPATTGQQVERSWRFGWVDVVVIIGVFALLRTVVTLGGDMRVQFDELHPPELSLDVALIPYYTARTVLRMFIAFAASLLFTLVWGYVAAKSPRARLVMLPVLDILQSVPVLGFLSITVTGFIALFPGSLLGVECASIFAIFTAQAWNMTFGFYHSMVTIPPDLQEAATAYQLNRWQRFFKVELPASSIGLIWNSMMSFGGGWFFVAQSEAITVLNKNIKLPGLGSYMATAAEQGDTRAAVYAIIAMIVTIVVIDQLFWRPLVAWAEKFKLEQTGSARRRDVVDARSAASVLSGRTAVRAGRDAGIARVAARLDRSRRHRAHAGAAQPVPDEAARPFRCLGAGGARGWPGSRSTRSGSVARSTPSCRGPRCCISSGSAC